MVVRKGGREYFVTELAQVWKAVQSVGGVDVEYQIPKEAAPDEAAAARYIMENDEIF